MGNTPNVRFKGFTEDWEQRKFSDIAVRESSISTSTTDIPSVEYEDVIAEEGRLNKDIRLKEVVKSGITFDGSQVLYGKLRPYLHNWLNPDFKGIAVGDWWVLKPINMDKKFLYRLIQTQQFDNIANQSSGSKMPRADWNLISNSEFMVPFSKEEQSKIGRYFDSLDHLITLHQQKCDETKELKKYMLQNMFPQKDEKVPKIRFDGFTGDWEQRKLSEFVDKAVDNRGKTPPIDDNGTHPLIEVAALGGVHPDYSKVEKYLNDDSFKNNLRAYVKEGDILFTTVGSIGLVSLMDSMEEAAIAQNIVAFRAKENFVPEYLYSLFSNEENQYKAKRIVMGAVQPSIKVSQLVDVEYMLTQNVKEQQKIGEYFSNLDNLITLHQQKCNALKEFKKYMLQNMFPQKGENKCQN